MKLQAANEIKKFLNGLKSLQEVLEADGVSEQAVEESKKELAKLKADKEAMLSVLKDLHAEVLKIQEDKKMVAAQLSSSKDEAQKEFERDHGILKAKFAELEKKFMDDVAQLQVSKDAMLKDLGALSDEVALKQKAHQEVIEKIESLKRGL